jgi:hypothetical protein
MRLLAKYLKLLILYEIRDNRPKKFIIICTFVFVDIIILQHNNEFKSPIFKNKIKL